MRKKRNKEAEERETLREGVFGEKGVRSRERGVARKVDRKEKTEKNCRKGERVRTN